MNDRCGALVLYQDKGRSTSSEYCYTAQKAIDANVRFRIIAASS
jgi:hypothetical protein